MYRIWPTLVVGIIMWSCRPTMGPNRDPISFSFSARVGVFLRNEWLCRLITRACSSLDMQQSA